ncbi:hypothetical protein MNBD_ALPHA09-901 [hydrothermal vent metagenome]|uniref:Cytochrome c oxidase subunit IV bacterial aa3 type domain-containing protein n=1 Tax=hydrothermal vent metagenome TaxID=652676 RepID=A0A3B0T9H5_9ZZZZ
MAELDIPAMDYDEHERTYDTFVEVFKTGTAGSIHALIAILLLTSVATGLGMAVAVVLTVAGVVASLIGFISGKGGWIAPAVISVLMIFQLIFVFS